jgi:SAM-dependent methyltransferase
MRQTIFHPRQWLFVYYVLRIGLDPRSWGSPRALIETTYRVMLRRPADAEGLKTWGEAIESGQIERTGFIWRMLCSREFRKLHPTWPLPSDSYEIAHILHTARCLLVQQELPAADSIVDLGGACAQAIEGALLWMGYPHPAREITIVDLPPEGRMFAETFAHQAEEHSDWIHVGHTRVRYLHTSMVDLSALADESADMVWSGQTIEHVTRQEARQVCAEVMRVLKPGGCFCLDTPNRALTQLQNPEGFIHPEHKYEYTVPELVAHLREAGLEVKRTLGICPMPRASRGDGFDLEEISDHGELSDDAENAYLFYIESVKPIT